MFLDPHADGVFALATGRSRIVPGHMPPGIS